MKRLLRIGGFLLTAVLLIGVPILLFFPHETVLRVGFPAGSYWEVPTSNSYAVLDAAIEQFEAEHPGVRVEYTSGIMKRDYKEWLMGKLLLDDAPDVFLIYPDDFSQLASMNALLPIAAEEERFYPAALEVGECDGVRYALPYECVPTLMMVNRTLLEKNGIAVPSENWTWDDFYEICRKVTQDTDQDGRTDTFGSYEYTWQNAVLENGTSIFAPDGSSCSLTDPSCVNAILFYMRLRELNADFSAKETDFDLGRVAFRPMLFSEYRTYQPYPWRIRKYSSFEWDCIKMPAGPSGTNTSQMTTLQLGISSRSRHKGLAQELLETLSCDARIQKRIYSDSQGCSALIEVTESEEISRFLREDSPGESGLALDILSDVMKNAVPGPGFVHYPEIAARTNTLVVQAMTDKENLPLNLANCQMEINRQMKEYGLAAGY